MEFRYMKNARDAQIHAALESAKVHDTLIMQKVNASHRIAFKEKFPNQLEHILRLLTERMQNGLDKRDNVVVDDVTTWKLRPEDLYYLSEAIYNIYHVKEMLSNDDIHRNINE